MFAEAVTKMLSKDYKRYDMGKKLLKTVKKIIGPLIMREKD